jgi:hypothetical protein
MVDVEVMEEDEPAAAVLQQQLQVVAPPAHLEGVEGTRSFPVVSGESDNGGHNDIYSDDNNDDEDDDDDDDDEPMYGRDPSNPSTADDDLYDANLDEEDESYVYKNLRGGIQETIQIRRRRRRRDPPPPSRATTEPGVSTAAAAVKNNDDPWHDEGEEEEELQYHNDNGVQEEEEELVSVHVYKPRTTDAVLSCPCCFNIVCMDCQRHSKYSDQFRAMFVMGIEVDWQTRLIYDDVRGGLQEAPFLLPGHVLHAPTHVPNSPLSQHPRHPSLNSQQQQQVVIEEGHEEEEGGDPISESSFVSVRCANCRTQVAALDLPQEVYHFFGCLESS